MVAGFDGADQEAVRGVHVAVPVEHQEGGRVGCVERAGGVLGRAARIAQEHLRVVDGAARLGADVGGLGEPPAPAGARRAQLGGADQGRDRGERVPPEHDPVRRVLKQFRHDLVRADGGRGEMPRAAFLVAMQSTSEGDVRAPALLVRGHRHDRRSDQRVPERDPGRGVVHAYQLCPLGRGEVGETGVIVQDGGPEHPGVAGAVERGEQQQPAGRFRQLGDPRREHRLEPVAERNHLGLRHRTVGAQQCGRQFHQRQRVALCEVEEPLPDPGRHLRILDVDQLSGGHAVERLDDHLGQPAPVEEVRCARSGRRQQAGWATLQAAGDESQNDGARTVDPLNVVDQEDDRHVPGDRVDKLECGVADEECVRGRAGAETERHRQRLPRTGREAVEVGVHREKQLVEAGVTDVGFELRSGRAQHPHSRREGGLRHGGQESGLTDARFTADQPRVTVLSREVEKIGEPFKLGMASEKFDIGHTPHSARCCPLPTQRTRRFHVRPGRRSARPRATVRECYIGSFSLQVQVGETGRIEQEIASFVQTPRRVGEGRGTG